MATFVGALAFTTGALAAPSVVDQYTEQVPSAGGETPANQTDPNRAGSGTGQTPSVAGTEQDGAAGGQTSGGSPPSAGSAGRQGVPETPGPATGTPGTEAEISNSVEEGGITGTVYTADGDGMGMLFPLTLIGVAVGLAAAVFLRRRSQADPHAG